MDPITCPQVALTGARKAFENEMRGSFEAYHETLALIEAREGGDAADTFYINALDAMDSRSWSTREGTAQALRAFTS
jgi:hypothetical protein